ncbi:flagellar biosynthesis protein FlgA [Nocardioides sp. HDW12B]|uniref:SAF domain-containing protein n=1 Tax=Nocardioides sp. HDW12B TaxID=2714939 RepID=UPI00140AB9A0|nr:SAF domain-containing protein [Nocardioides sp. HDW12B]QIK65596.1 flagellar biosynthesis protein FlgA [Nocardioides sp. HDW12B]
MSLAPSPPAPATHAHEAVGSPTARRAARPGWRDPRFAVGLVLVALSVVVGVRVVDGRDDTTPVLAAARPLAAGEELAPDDVTVVEVRFTSEDDADRYLPADGSVTSGGSEPVVLTRGVGAGELLPRTATSTDVVADVQVPLAVPLGRVPSTVQVGSVVDVWATSDPADALATGDPGEPATTGSRTGAAGAERVLQEVPVLALGRGQGLGPDSEIRVVVGVPDRGDTVAEVVRTVATSGVLVVHRPEGS